MIRATASRSLLLGSGCGLAVGNSPLPHLAILAYPPVHHDGHIAKAPTTTDDRLTPASAPPLHQNLIGRHRAPESPMLIFATTLPTGAKPLLWAQLRR